MIKRFESVCESAATLVQRRQGTFLSLYVLVFLVYFLRLDWAREMWTDEFYSLYISRQPLGEMWKAILTGADQHPPLFYLLTHYCLAVFGENQFVLRVPATLGFLLMTLCVFRFTLNRLPAVYAFLAMVFPLLTGAVYYGQEGRGYGLVLGFATLSLLCWQTAADEGRGRLIALVGMAVGLSAAVGCHYYASFVLLPLAAGEIVRTASRGRPDWPVWIAFSAPVLTLVAFLPAIQSAMTYGPTFWAAPLLRYAFEYFHILFRDSAVPLVGGVLVLTAYAQLSKGSASDVRPAADGLRTHEIAALAVAVALPLVVVLLAKIGAGGFHSRYVLFPVVAFAIMLAASVAVLPMNRAVAGSVALGLCLLWISVRASDRLMKIWSSDNGNSEYTFLRVSGDSGMPIVVSDTSILFRLAYYGPEDISKRVVYLADPEAQLRYMKHDTVDKGLLALRPWFPVNVQPYREYVDQSRDFLVYGPMDGNWNWLVYAFAADGVQPELLTVRDGRLLLRVRPRTELRVTRTRYSDGRVAASGNTHPKAVVPARQVVNP